MERWVLATFVAFFLLHYAIETALLLVNLRHVRNSGGAPAPLAGSVDEATADRSRAYTLAVLLSGLLPRLDAALAARGVAGAHRFVAFLAILGAGGALVSLPLAAW